MHTILAELGYLLLMSLPVTAFAFWLFRRVKRERSEAKTPFRDLPRPAGESNRLRVEELDEWINPWLAVLIMTPILCAAVLAAQKANWITVSACFVLSTVVAALAHHYLQPLLQKRSAYQLGFHGERCVAEELNQLMLDGFRVFHDVPFTNHNIDHVLIGPTGVFVVETKTRRKRNADRAEKHKVLFDGTQLNFPGGKWDRTALEQSRLNAKTFEQWLNSATADRLRARAILTIPGWFVERSASSDVYVTNPKQIRSFVLNATDNPLTPTEIQRAAHQLEQKCRISVE